MNTFNGASDVALVEFLRSELAEYFTCHYDEGTAYTIEFAHNDLQIRRVSAHEYHIILFKVVLMEANVAISEDDCDLRNKIQSNVRSA